MMRGKNADNSVIKPEYTFFTKQAKIKKGRDPDVVTLYDSGDFHNNMFLDVGSDEFEIDSMDYKSDLLKAKYGERIFGLSDESKEEYISEVFPEFKDEVENSLKLEMK